MRKPRLRAVLKGCTAAMASPFYAMMAVVLVYRILWKTGRLTPVVAFLAVGEWLSSMPKPTESDDDNR